MFVFHNRYCLGGLSEKRVSRSQEKKRTPPISLIDGASFFQILIDSGFRLVVSRTFLGRFRYIEILA